MTASTQVVRGRITPDLVDGPVSHGVWWGQVPPLEQFLPGAVVIVVDEPEAALAASVAARMGGWEVRDTLTIVTSDGVLLAPMLRRPFRGSLTANVAARGTGALNIDGCRILPPGAVEVAGEGLGYGRFPADVVFVHHSDCAQVAVGDGGGAGGVAGVVQRVRFDCHRSCPVVVLDAQSGVLKSGANPARRVSDSKSVSMSGLVRARAAEPVRRGAEEGGASRFYACLTSLDDVNEWLVRLVAPPCG